MSARGQQPAARSSVASAEDKPSVAPTENDCVIHSNPNDMQQLTQQVAQLQLMMSQLLEAKAGNPTANAPVVRIAAPPTLQQISAPVSFNTPQPVRRPQQVDQKTNAQRELEQARLELKKVQQEMLRLNQALAQRSEAINAQQAQRSLPQRSTPLVQQVQYCQSAPVTASQPAPPTQGC